MAWTYGCRSPSGNLTEYPRYGWCNNFSTIPTCGHTQNNIDGNCQSSRYTRTHNISNNSSRCGNNDKEKTKTKCKDTWFQGPTPHMCTGRGTTSPQNFSTPEIQSQAAACAVFLLHWPASGMTQTRSSAFNRNECGSPTKSL